MRWMRVVGALLGAWLLFAATAARAQAPDDLAQTHIEALKQHVEPAPATTPPPPEPVQGATEAAEPASRASLVDEPREVSERFVQALALFGVAGAGAITFVVAGSLALKKDQLLAKSCGRHEGRTCSDDQVRGLRTRTTVADVGLGLLAMGSLIGITLLWLDRRENARRAAGLRPVASFDTHGASFALGGRF
jgi:hypothetical protein